MLVTHGGRIDLRPKLQVAQYAGFNVGLPKVAESTHIEVQAGVEQKHQWRLIAPKGPEFT